MNLKPLHILILLLSLAFTVSSVYAQAPAKKLPAEKKKIEVRVQDTVSNENKIKNVYVDNDIVKITLEVKDQDNSIRLSVFNMLAKEIKVVFEGQHKQGIEYTFNASSLPNGVYLCVLQGKNFRDVKKFFIQR